MKIACISLGCPKNQVDLDVMVHILLSAGHETVADLAEADVILVNTCGFIESAKKDSVDTLLAAADYKHLPPLKVHKQWKICHFFRSFPGFWYIFDSPPCLRQIFPINSIKIQFFSGS